MAVAFARGMGFQPMLVARASSPCYKVLNRKERLYMSKMLMPLGKKRLYMSKMLMPRFR